jgi:GNAT superfamily N-acetyltransferase
MQTARETASGPATIVDWTPDLDAHAEQIVAAVFAEYGFGFYPDDYDGDLRSIESTYLTPGGIFRFLLVGGQAVGTVAVKPLSADECELKRLYLLADYRRSGYGGRLLDSAVSWATERGFESMITWSDTRFEDAHFAYQSRGFRQIGVRPEPGPDPAEEYGFRLRLHR